MSPRVRFEDEAEIEYREAGRWYEGHRTGLGLEFLDAVDQAINRIVDLPSIGTRLDSLPADLPVRRHAVTRFPYHVVYLLVSEQIQILAVAHDRRKPGYWKSRLKP